MIGVYNTIQLNGVELFRPNDFSPKREDIYGAEITTCSGKVIADRVGWRYADMTLQWDTLPQAQLDVLLAVTGQATLVFTDADGVTHRGFRITATENTAYKRTATVTLTAADGTQETLRVVQTGVYPDAEVTVDPKQIEFNADEIVPVDVSFTTNMGDVYAVSRDEDADWISWEDLGGNVIRFTAAPWDDEEQPRTANVYITVGSLSRSWPKTSTAMSGVRRCSITTGSNSPGA